MGGAISKRSGTSLKHQIFLVLRDRILNGQLEAGEPLPSEDELGQLFAVSRVTIRSAMASLEADHLVERRQGVGTFVSHHIRQAYIHAPVSDLIAHIDDINKKTEVRVIEFDYVKVPIHIQSMFGPEAGDIFQRSVRLRSVGRQPVFYITTFLPQYIAREFSREELDKSSLNQLLARGGVKMHSGRQVVSAQLADPIVAPLLGVEIGAPLIQVRREHIDEKQRVVEYLEVLASPSVFELRMVLDAENLA